MKINKESGQASRLLLVLAIVVLVAAIITYLVIKMAEQPQGPNPPPDNTIPAPIYEQTLGDIRFVFEVALDKDGILKVSEIKSSQYNYQRDDLPVSNPGAKFIQVTVGAQNVGIQQTVQGAWDIQNIVDDKGRNFAPLGDYQVNAWLPSPNLCGTILQPAFDPTPCDKIYEVSKASTGLKIRVQTGQNNGAISTGKVTSYLLDLIVK